TAYGETTTTNQYGTFVLKNLNVNKDRCVLQFAKAGFFNRSHGMIASGNTVNYVRIILISDASTQSVSASAGGTVSLTDGSSVLFQPNSFVTTNGSAYTGTVNIAIKHLSPDDANFGFMIPGGDLLGKDLNDNDVALYTYGMLGVILTGSSGETLQLATGITATLTMSIAASQLASAPATIPLWYFDETTSLWKEEGTANKVGNNYVGTVTHFSWWNFDYQGPRAYIKGRVVDCEGIPLPNINVTVNGWYVMTTDQNGEYFETVPCGMTFNVQVLNSNNSTFILDSQLENVPALSVNQIYPIPDLIVPCITRVVGNIKSCSGEITDGLVYLLNSSNYIYQYTLNGSFNLSAPNNAQMVLYAMNASNVYYSQNITTLSAPNDLNIGNVLLCDTTSSTGNSFALIGGPFSNQVYTINATLANGYSTGGLTLINLEGHSSPYDISFYQFEISGYTVGTFSAYMGIEMINSVTNAYNISSTTSLNFVNITQIDSVGGRIKGNYHGDCDIYDYNSSITYPGTFSGSFDVIRTP
ncbi:MAG: carboxypeptidase-like regulatory domain-containing protein, partial [Bacteroidia bacterium]